MKIVAAFLILFALSTALCGSMNANTIVVSERTDSALRSAIANAAPGDTITFDPALFVKGPETISVNGEILINKNLTLVGPENVTLTFQGANGGIFVIGDPAGCYVLLRNLRLCNGVAVGKEGETRCTGGGGGAGLGGAIYVNCAVLTCQNVTFENNLAVGGNGGGCYKLNEYIGGKGGDACSANLIWQNLNGALVRGQNSGGAGGHGDASETFFGGSGGYACGGGGGSGETLSTISTRGGVGGWGGGGGGGGGAFIISSPGGNGGEFGGKGGDGQLLNIHGGGGGGAGLGGAIFVDSWGGLIVENCVFRSNMAIGGGGKERGQNGQGKGGAIFAKAGVLFKIYNTQFIGNTSATIVGNVGVNASGSGYLSGSFSDTADIYGTATSLEPTPTPTATPIPCLNLTVTTALDEEDDRLQGTGLSLREALRLIGDGGQIDISDSILPATLTIDSVSSQFIIEKNVKIKAPENKLFVMDGNQGRAFFIKKGHLYLENIKIIHADATGGNGGEGSYVLMGGGGAAGMGGAIFVNSNAALTCVGIQFEENRAQGGKGGQGIYAGVFANWGGGGGGIGGSGEPVFLNEETYAVSGGRGGSGWPLSSDRTQRGNHGEEGSGGGGYAGTEKVGGNGGFGGGGGGSMTKDFGIGGFGGGGGGWTFDYDVRTMRSKPEINSGGQFGGDAIFNGGGGGAGLGGALFVREGGTVVLDRCEFMNNSAKGGDGGIALIPAFQINGRSGQGKGGSVFVMDNATAKVRDCKFNGKSTANPGEIDGFAYETTTPLDIPDIYGVMHGLTDGDISAFPVVESTPTPNGEETPTPTITPTPYASPTQEIQPTATPRPKSNSYTFSGQTAEENHVILQGAGFGAYPQAAVSFGAIPTDNAFDGATDGQGVIITAKPGEGVMVFGERVDTNYAAMIRCSVRTEQGHAAVTIATIGDKPDQFVATNSPADETYFAGQYQRLAVFYTPPSTGFQPVVQIVNTSTTEALTAYLDNLEVYPLNPAKYYSAAFLDNDAIDPPADKISIPSSSESGVVDEDEPIIPATITVALSADSKTEVVISWSATSASRDLITVQRATDPNNETNWEDVSESFFNDVDMDFVDRSLSPNTVYYYRLSVYNEVSQITIYSKVFSVRTGENS